MSKRAGELAKKLYRVAEDSDGNDSRMADLIDDELCKERERCAKRAINYIDGLAFIDPKALHAAILDEKKEGN